MHPRARWTGIVWLIGGVIALPFVLCAAWLAYGFLTYLLLGHT